VCAAGRLVAFIGIVFQTRGVLLLEVCAAEEGVHRFDGDESGSGLLLVTMARVLYDQGIETWIVAINGKHADGNDN
jgi:hypothetical protein